MSWEALSAWPRRPLGNEVCLNDHFTSRPIRWPGMLSNCKTLAAVNCFTGTSPAGSCSRNYQFLVPSLAVLGQGYDPTIENLKNKREEAMPQHGFLSTFSSPQVLGFWKLLATAWRNGSQLTGGFPGVCPWVLPPKSSVTIDDHVEQVGDYEKDQMKDQLMNHFTCAFPRLAGVRLQAYPG